MFRKRSQRPSNESPPLSPHTTHNPRDYNQSAQSTPVPVGSSTQGPGPTYFVQGGPDGAYRGNVSSSPTGIAHSNSFSSQDSQPNVEQDECRAWFMAIDQDGDEELSYEELHSALFNTGGLPFSANTVKYLVSIFDQDGNGVIGYDEFEPLWKYLNQWRQMFDSFDTDGDGKIDAIELGSALAHYQIHIAPHILEMLVNKYAEVPSRNRHGSGPARPQLDLDHFVCACVVVRRMCGLYEECCAGGSSPISKDDFLQAIISLP